MSREDQKFMKILQEGTTLRNGHYQVPLPFKEPYVNLPNNRYQAMQRFSYLEKKFSKSDQLKEDYIRFMKDIIIRVMPGNQPQKQPLERFGTYPIMVSTIQTSLER